MKRTFLIIATLFFAVALHAQQTFPTPVDSTAKAKITFEQTNHDFGVIEVGADGSTLFKFKNEGTVPLVLANVQASCGCTTPSWTREPVAPGASGEIKVTYDTKRIGSFSKSITVTSNAANSPVILRIAGEVKAPATQAAPTTN
jgi:hypothetical protein